MTLNRKDWLEVADAAASRSSSWCHSLHEQYSSGGAQLPAHARFDAEGLSFTHRLLEAVAGASDPFSAAMGVREASKQLPASLPTAARVAVRLGGIASLGLPWAVLPAARKWLRDQVSHLVISAKIPKALPRTLQGDAATYATSPTHAAAGNADGNSAGIRSILRAAAATEDLLALGGAKVLGRTGAELELRRLLALAQLPEVHSLAVDVDRIVPVASAGSWALDQDATVGTELLRELFACAQRHDTSIILESHSYRSAILAPQLLLNALDTGELMAARVGVRLPAEVPESAQQAQVLAKFSGDRLAAGGSPLEITVGVAGCAAAEQIDAIHSGLAVAIIADQEQQLAALLRTLVPLCEAGRAVRTTVASDDIQLLAAATVLAEHCGSSESLTVQTRAGTVPALETLLSRHGFRVRRRIPLVPSREFAGAVHYLIGLAAETASATSSFSRFYTLLSRDPAHLNASQSRVRQLIDLASRADNSSHRGQQRRLEWSEQAADTVAYYRDPTQAHRLDTGGLTAAVLGLKRDETGTIALTAPGKPLRIPVVSASGFANEPDTDAVNFDNRQWMRELLCRAATNERGADLLRSARLRGEHLDTLIRVARDAGAAWARTRPANRGLQLSRLALRTASAREHLSEALASESGAPAHVLDAEINRVIDAVRYHGQRAGSLATIRGAQFIPDELALVVADAAIPLSEIAEALAAALAAGCAVILVPHSSVARSAAVLVDEWQQAGLPSETLQCAVAPNSETLHHDHRTLAARVATDSRVARAGVLGSADTAHALLRHRPELPVAGTFRGSGVCVITPSADPVAAARDVVRSAFGTPYADLTTARILVLLGPAARSKTLRRALIDAVASLRIGNTAQLPALGGADPLSFEFGPLPDQPQGAGLRALTQLAAGEQWWLQPQCVHAETRLWHPGIRAGISRDASFWKDAVGMPVLGVVTAHTIDEAITLTNRLGSGTVAALFSEDPQETVPWLERVQAAKLSVARPTTGAKIERHPCGAWGAAGMGAAVLAGGPNRLHAFGSWQPRPGMASSTLHLRGLTPEVRLLIEQMHTSLDYRSFDRVRRAALSDALAWRTSFRGAVDVSGLGIEWNLLRHRPVHTQVRLAEHAPVAELVRVLAAGFVARAPMAVSTGVVLPPPLSALLTAQGVTVALERDDDWLERIAIHGPEVDGSPASRIRLIGGDATQTLSWLGGSHTVTVWADPVTMAGPVELLAFVKEQSISITAHRHDLALLPSGIGSWLSELNGHE